MEGRFSMKTRSIAMMLITVGALVMAGCQKESVEQSENGKSTHHLIINAGLGETRTSMEAISEGYQIHWDVDDFIQLHEAMESPAIEDYDVVRSYDSDPIQESDIVGNKAAFSFEMEDRAAESAKYSYIATYGPYSYADYIDWTTYEYEYEYWASAFDYTGEYVQPHMVVKMQFPMFQQPRADSFDPFADMMVSKLVTAPSQLSGEASFSFARLGTVVKMTLTGLEKHIGSNVQSLSLTFGESYSLPYELQYDPILNKYAPFGYGEGDFAGGNSQIMVESEEIIVKEDGTADVWLRVLAGEVTDWFRVDLRICDENGDYELARSVDLASLGKTIKFNEGKMTTFSVGGLCLADVEPVGYIDYVINAGKTGFTATWEGVENASDYECFVISSSEVKTSLSVVDNGDGTYSAIAGDMPKDSYTIFVRPIPAEGHELLYNDYTTEYILLGVPTVWWFAHDAFKDCEATDVDGEYIIDFSPGKVRFCNLAPKYDASWQVLSASGPWFMYSTEPLDMHSIEVWSKDDSHLSFDVYASSAPGAESLLLAGEVVEVSEINAGEGSYKYEHVHKRVRYTFPEDGGYQYYMIKGDGSGIVMTSQYTYVYYYE